MSDRRNNTFRETIRRERRPSNTNNTRNECNLVVSLLRVSFCTVSVTEEMMKKVITVSTLWMKKAGKVEQDRERGGEDGNGGVRVPMQFEGGLQDGVDRHEEETEGRRDDVGIIDRSASTVQNGIQKRPRGNTEKEKPQ